jgi:hypothetical protein
VCQAWAQRFTRWIARKFYAPVGGGVKTDAEGARLVAQLFPGDKMLPGHDLVGHTAEPQGAVHLPQVIALEPSRANQETCAMRRSQRPSASGMSRYGFRI